MFGAMLEDLTMSIHTIGRISNQITEARELQPRNAQYKDNNSRFPMSAAEVLNASTLCCNQHIVRTCCTMKLVDSA
jgi:hypothetical protein